MSTLGKILTVLVVLVAVGVAVSVTISVVLNDNWKALQTAEHANFVAALEERDSAIRHQDEEKAARGEERAGLNTQVNNLKADVDKRDQELKQMDLNMKALSAQLVTLTTDITGLHKDLETAQAKETKAQQERLTAVKTADDLTKANSDLDQRLRVTLKSLADSTETVRQLAEDKKAEQSKLAWIQQNFPDVKLPSAVPPQPPEKIRGLVTRVDTEAKLVTINLGSDDGVVAGMKFYVYNGSDVQYLATLLVTMVSKDSAAGELTVIKGTVRVNDHVTNRF